MKERGETKAEVRKGRKAREWKGTKLFKNEDEKRGG
jgi:hypothetical protein